MLEKGSKYNRPLYSKTFSYLQPEAEQVIPNVNKGMQQHLGVQLEQSDNKKADQFQYMCNPKEWQWLECKLS